MALLRFDLTFLPLVEKIAAQLPSVKHFVLMTDRAHMPASSTLPGLPCYDELVEAERGDHAWPEFDENTASTAGSRPAPLSLWRQPVRAFPVRASYAIT